MFKWLLKVTEFLSFSRNREKVQRKQQVLTEEQLMKFNARFSL